jgi:hypothetical protein
LYVRYSDSGKFEVKVVCASVQSKVQMLDLT